MQEIEIIQEYIEHYKRRMCGEIPHASNVKFFTDELMWYVKRYIERGYSVSDAIDKVIRDRNN
jgi:hypothetical protein